MGGDLAFTYLSEWLIEKIKPGYDKGGIGKYAARGHKPLVGIMSALWKLFDEHICGEKAPRLRMRDGLLYAYNGSWFEEVDGVAFLKELVRRVLAELGVSATYQFCAPMSIAKELIGNIRHTEACKFKPDRRYICFANGVLDLRGDRRLKPFKIDYVTDIILDFDYNPAASSVLWDIKLGSKTQGIIPNRGLRNDFQQFCGSLLASRNQYKKEYICYLYGGGGNGKSVLAAAIAGVFGERYYSTFSLQQIFSRQTNSLFVAKEMDGKLFNWCDDVEEKDVSGGEFKRFVSGEAIPGRSPYAADFTKVRPPMLLCCINIFPDVSDDSEGNHRRQLIIETTHRRWSGEERDTALSAKLATPESRAAIFNWILDGYYQFIRNGGDIRLSEDAAMARATRIALSNPMRRWAYERGFIYARPYGNNDPRWKRLTECYSDYVAYCAENGCGRPVDSRKIAAMLRSMGFESERWSGGTMFCIGVSEDTNEDGTYKGASEDENASDAEDKED